MGLLLLSPCRTHASILLCVSAIAKPQNHISITEPSSYRIPITEKLLKAISLENSVAQWRGFVPKASIGISVFPDHGEDIDSLLRAADVAMYQAKSEGKSQCRFYNDEFAQKIRDRVSTERALEQAIQNDEFIVFTSLGHLLLQVNLPAWRHWFAGVIPCVV